MIYKFQVIIYIGKIILWLLNEEVFVFTTTFSHPLAINNIYYLQECINFEIKNKKISYVISLHYTTHPINVNMILTKIIHALMRILEINIILLFLKKSLQANAKTSIEESRQNYYSRLPNKLLDCKTSLKLYWSILKTFLNNRRIPYIPPLLHNGKFIMNFKEKAELFNDFFTRQCSLVNNNSKLPSVLTNQGLNQVALVLNSSCQYAWNLQIF